jgi:L-rhamnose-H+ transport protein
MVPEASFKGIVVVTLAGMSNGSFPAPSKGMRYWKWEHIWLVYSLCAMCLLPVVLGAVFAHGMIARLVGRDIVLAGEVCAFGALWGLGSLLFGVSLPRLGMAVTNALVSGVLVFLGSLGPILTGAVHINRGHLLWLMGGLSLLALSLVLCASASVSRDRARGPASSSPRTQGRSLWAVLIALLAGALSSMINMGFVVGAPLARNALSHGAPVLLATVAIWIPALLGGLLFNIGYPVYLICKRRSWDLFVSGPECAGCWLRSLRAWSFADGAFGRCVRLGPAYCYVHSYLEYLGGGHGRVEGLGAEAENAHVVFHGTVDLLGRHSIFPTTRRLILISHSFGGRRPTVEC